MMNRRERVRIEQYRAEVSERRKRSLMDALVPGSMANVRRRFGLPESQRHYGGNVSPEEENEMLKRILLDVCEALESETMANADNAATVGKLNSTLKELRRKLDAQSRPVATSENSGIPPSRNPISQQETIRKRTRSLREKSGRPVGGQPGHKGSTIRPREDVDATELIFPESESCPKCGAALPRALFTEGERHQVVDLCEKLIRTVEKVSMEARCPVCGTTVRGTFGNLENGRVNYGTKLQALATLLNNRHSMPYARTAELINDLTGLGMSQGTVCNMVGRAGSLSERETTKMARSIADAGNGCPFVFADETGAGSGRWLWVFGNDRTVLTVMTGSRSHDEILKVFPEGFRDKYLLTDRHSAYFTSDVAVMGHQICLVHIERNIRYYVDFFPKYEWPKRLLAMVRELMHRSKQTDDDVGRLKLHDEYKARLVAMLEEPTQRSDLPSDTAVEYIDQFKQGLIKRKDDFLSFLLVHMPYHNNRAEQCLRQTKVKMKVSGCYRSDNGGKHYANIQSIVQTCRMNGENIYGAMLKLFTEGDIVEEIS